MIGLDPLRMVRAIAGCLAAIGVSGLVYFAATASINIPNSWAVPSDSSSTYDDGVLTIIHKPYYPIRGCGVAAHVPADVVAQINRGQLHSSPPGYLGNDVTYWHMYFRADANGAANLDTIALVRDRTLEVRPQFEYRPSRPIRFQLIDPGSIPAQCAPPGEYELWCGGPTLHGCREIQSAKMERYEWRR